MTYLATNSGAERRTGPSPVRQLVAFVSLVSVGLVALGAYLIVDSRTVARETAYRNNQSLTASIENNIARTFEGYDLSVQALIANFQRANVSTLRPELRQLLLFDRFAFTP